MQFTNVKKSNFDRTYTFTLSPLHVTYANTLRRLILTGVETIAFRSDMTTLGTTTDVQVKRNDTPMTNEMLADRIGLLPIHVTEPLKWKDSEHVFRLSVAGNADHTTYVKSGDFKVVKVADVESKTEEDEETVLSAEKFFPRHPITNDTCLIAMLQPGAGSSQQMIEIVAKATKGTGREHARFSPVSQCSYEYSVATDPVRVEDMFMKWLASAKKVGTIDKASERYAELLREFNTMQVKRCFQINDKGEPFSYDFTVETVGVLPVTYIVQRACEVGENICSRYVNTDKGELPSEITISSSDSRIIGYDFLIRGHDHTLGNLLQTWLVEHHIEGDAQPKITYAGYSVPHPLRDEIVLRIGVEDGEQGTARQAFAEAAKGCTGLFRQLRGAWQAANGMATATAVRSRPAVAPSSLKAPAAVPEAVSAAVPVSVPLKKVD